MDDPKGMYGRKVGDEYLAFRAPKQLYDDLAGTLGLEKIDTDAEKAKAIMVTAANGRFWRLRISYEKAGVTTGNKTRGGSLWCAPDKVEEARTGLIGKDYRTGNPIIGVAPPLDSSRH